jgi:predicted alpha/beta-fold hydrolase
MGALDDPCISVDNYPYKELETNPKVITAFTKSGGHASHFTGGFRPASWYPEPLLEFFEFLENNKRNEKITKSIKHE